MCLDVDEQWAPEDTSTPIKPDARKEAAAASRTLDETDRSLAGAGTLSHHLIACYVICVMQTPHMQCSYSYIL